MKQQQDERTHEVDKTIRQRTAKDVIDGALLGFTGRVINFVTEVV